MGANRGETAEFIGAGKDSKRQVYRYVRLSYLNDFLLSLIDSGKISVQTGTEFAFLDEESQESLVEYIEKLKQIPSLEQAKMLRAAEEENDQSLSYEKILSLLVSVPKPKVQNKVSFKTKELADYFAEGTSADEMSDIIKRLLEKYRSGEFELN
jgi:ParB family chromosome partitioning protein